MGMNMELDVEMKIRNKINNECIGEFVVMSE